MIINESSKLKNILEKINPSSCPFQFNLHTHTTFSDGSMTPLELIKQAADLKVKYISITDHHSTESYPVISDWIKTRISRDLYTPNLISGIEVSCLLNKCLVHVLGYGFDVNHPSIRPYTLGEAPSGSYLQASSFCKAIHKANGIVFLAHPARYRLPFNTLIEAAKINGFDGIEVWYDYNFNTTWTPSPVICSDIKNLSDKLNLLSSCGTDTHGYSLTGR